NAVGPLNEVLEKWQLIRYHAQDREDAIVSNAALSALGRFLSTSESFDIAKFRTPSLRNVAHTAPYMHDGSVETLFEAIELEANYRDDFEDRSVAVTQREKEDLLEFLRSLTSDRLCVQ